MGWRDSTAGSVFVCLECGPVQVLILGIPYGPPPAPMGVVPNKKQFTCT